MGRKWMRTILALLMIVAGLTGFLWEFRVMNNKYFTAWDTHYGNRFEYHFSGVMPPDNIAYLLENDMESGLRTFLEGNMLGNVMYYTFNGARRNVPGIEWLATPKLPQGSTVESVRWMAGGSIIYFEGNVSGSFRILDPKEYRHIIKACRQLEEWRSLGSSVVRRHDGGMMLVGASNGLCYFGRIKIPDGVEFTDEQIRELGIKLAVPQSWEVTLLVLVNVLRGLCLAVAVTGVVMLVIPVLKRKKTAPAVL